MADEQEMLTAKVPTPLAQRARVVAALTGISKSELLRRAVSDYLAAHGYPVTSQNDLTSPAVQHAQQ